MFFINAPARAAAAPIGDLRSACGGSSSSSSSSSSSHLTDTLTGVARGVVDDSRFTFLLGGSQCCGRLAAGALFSAPRSSGSYSTTSQPHASNSSRGSKVIVSGRATASSMAAWMRRRRLDAAGLKHGRLRRFFCASDCSARAARSNCCLDTAWRFIQNKYASCSRSVAVSGRSRNRNGGTGSKRASKGLPALVHRNLSQYRYTLQMI
mmetsp:Transcript_6981/g.15542  ORF Transcript_6981/g.15542 Transcript_6981/m.15542 type:complete len:208 (+) Transcript_6981:326-949(+)